MTSARADDRGGREQDYENYVLLLRNLRQYFDKIHPDWGLSIAIPASYWYLQHFDINEMQKYVSWFKWVFLSCMYPSFAKTFVV